MPRVDDLLRKISKSHCISTVDASKGYWQLPVREEDKYKTAFVVGPGHHYEWNVAAFGLKCSGETFQRMIDELLSPHAEYAGAYIDDAAVHSFDFDAHIIHLDAVLTSFGNANLTLKLSKCTWAKPNVNFVGFNVGSGVESIQVPKIKAILDLKEPTTKKLLRKFLGMTSFFRKFIPNYSEISGCLTDMTKKEFGVKIAFGPKEKLAFQTLKAKLCEAPVLRAADSSRDYYLHCDASEMSVGCCVLQLDDEGVLKPVSYASSKLSETQRRWSVLEREAYSIIFALKTFDVILFGQKIIIFSDHNPLKFLINSIPNSSKLTRWALSLQRYNIAIEYIRGKDNVVSDYLSRG